MNHLKNWFDFSASGSHIYTEQPSANSGSYLPCKSAALHLPTFIQLYFPIQLKCDYRLVSEVQRPCKKRILTVRLTSCYDMSVLEFIVHHRWAEFIKILAQCNFQIASRRNYVKGKCVSEISFYLNIVLL